MKAAVLHSPGDIRLEEVPIPEINPNEALVRVKAAGICGSDVPRVMTTGTYHFPTIPGHEFAGVIVKTGKKVKGISVGERVTVIPCIPCRKCKYCEGGNFFHCQKYNYLGSRTNGGFAEYAKAPADNLILLPEGVDFEEGACTEPVSVSLHIMNRAGGVEPGNWVAVFGGGPIGNFCAQWAKALGAEKVFIVDIVREKLEVAKRVGIGYQINAKEQSPVKTILDTTEGDGVDISIEAAGAEVTLQQCLQVTRREGKVVVVGRPGQDICLPQKLISQFLRKELSILGGWGFEFVNFPHNAWRTSLYFLEQKKIQVKPLITHRLALKEAHRIFEMMHKGEEYFHKILFIP